jgi:hypothetical protein
MNTKLFAIKVPENEKNAMDYISKITKNTLSKVFYKPLQNAIYTNLGLILLYKIDLRNTAKISDINIEFFDIKENPNQSLPIIEDFIGLMLDKNLRTAFWSIFNDIQINEKDFLFHELDLTEIAFHVGKEYVSRFGNFEEIDLNLTRTIYFNYMLMTYFNITAMGSIQKLNHEWTSNNHQIKNFQEQLITKYLTRFQEKKVEAMKVDEIFEVSEYVE